MPLQSLNRTLKMNTPDPTQAPPAHEFQPWPKMARLSREIIITEKIDGTNAQVYVVPLAELSTLFQVTYYDEQFAIFAGSRTRWIVPGNDNYGFAAWVRDNGPELVKLGPGRHYGEWFGAGIQRRYGLEEKRFALFNTLRWGYVDRVSRGPVVDLKTCLLGPMCCHVVPVLYRGEFNTVSIELIVDELRDNGSAAVPGFMKPEGIVIFHVAAGIGFKKTLENDEAPKSTIVDPSANPCETVP